MVGGNSQDKAVVSPDIYEKAVSSGTAAYGLVRMGRFGEAASELDLFEHDRPSEIQTINGVPISALTREAHLGAAMNLYEKLADTQHRNPGDPDLDDYRASAEIEMKKWMGESIINGASYVDAAMGFLGINRFGEAIQVLESLERKLPSNHHENQQIEDLRAAVHYLKARAYEGASAMYAAKHLAFTEEHKTDGEPDLDNYHIASEEAAIKSADEMRLAREHPSLEAILGKSGIKF